MISILFNVSLTMWTNYVINQLSKFFHFLKRHGNEADFLGFLHELVPHKSLMHYRTFHAVPILAKFVEIIVIGKRLPDSTSRGVNKIVQKCHFSNF
jgi:hypothetical protein